MHARSISMAAATAIVACGGGASSMGGPANAPTTAATSSGSTGASGASDPIDACAKDEDCILVAGNPCSPCGACPGSPEQGMTPARLDRILKETEYCPKRDYLDPKMQTQPPNCSPCENPPPGWTGPKMVHCSAGACVVR